MFRRFNRLVSLLNFKLDTLSLYGDAMACTFFNKKLKYSYKPNSKIQYKKNNEFKDNKIPIIKNTL